jgi:hypothetical protein
MQLLLPDVPDPSNFVLLYYKRLSETIKPFAPDGLEQCFLFKASASVGIRVETIDATCEMNSVNDKDDSMLDSSLLESLNPRRIEVTCDPDAWVAVINQRSTAEPSPPPLQ